MIRSKLWNLCMIVYPNTLTLRTNTSRENTLNYKSTNRETACLQLRCVCVVESYRYNLSSWAQAYAMAREWLNLGRRLSSLHARGVRENIRTFALERLNYFLILEKKKRKRIKCSNCIYIFICCFVEISTSLWKNKVDKYKSCMYT